MTSLLAKSIDSAHPLILADAHVHIYNCFSLEQFLNSAFENFQKTVAKLPGKLPSFSLLFLTETSGNNWFKTLVEYAEKKQNIEDWKFNKTSEPESIYAENPQQQGMFLIAGRQIITSENLEVLALITDQTFADGSPLPETLQMIREAGGLPILPWGFGKWIGRRGKVLSNLLKSDDASPLFLGDNGGRPIFWRRPAYFQLAEAKGLRILPGTDPLPLTSEITRPGSFGFQVRGSFNQQEPGKSMKEILLRPETIVHPYGSLQTPWNFIRNQVQVRYQNQE
ncbi:MAG: hypothetical protein KA714_16940 [Limnoraphis sp. WC205]|jgi:hypothetical protein|nr:hypothetical protein [Limnoraphis sp. WC205]